MQFYFVKLNSFGVGYVKKQFPHDKWLSINFASEKHMFYGAGLPSGGKNIN